MERIKINTCEPKFGKPNAEGVCTPFWACLLSDGRKATIWDQLLAKTAMDNLGKELMVEIKITPQGFNNIRSLNIATGEDVGSPLVGMPSTEVPTSKTLSVKDEIIVAQVILKGAVELAKIKEPDWDDNEGLGEFLGMAVNELTGAYKLALSNIQGL